MAGSALQEKSAELYTIRKATEKDCGAILKLIVELAVFEKMEDQVHMSVEKLQKDGFGVNPLFYCFVCQRSADNDIIGYLLYYYIYSTWDGKRIYIEDIYITPDHRRSGLGTRFLQEVAKVAVLEDCDKLRWAVLDWNAPAIQLYDKVGGVDVTVEEKLHMYGLARENIEALANREGIALQEKSTELYTIRKATEKDCSAILKLIVELAAFEKNEDQVHMSVERLQKDGFGANPLFYCFVCQRSLDNDIIGYLLYYYIYSTWDGKCIYIQDIYITPDHRRSSLGTRFLQEVAKVAVSEDCDKLRWAVLDWNAPAIQLYDKVGGVDATVEEKWHVYGLARENIEALARREECP